MSEVYDWAKENLEPQDGGWLAGFIAGEGHFDLHRCLDSSYSTKLSIKLREDDRQALEEIKRLWGVENRLSRKRGKKRDRPQLELSISKIAILRNRIIPTFRLYPLRAKKQKDFEIWAEAIEILYQKKIARTKRYKQWERNRLDELIEELKRARQYIEPEEVRPLAVAIIR